MVMEWEWTKGVMEEANVGFRGSRKCTVDITGTGSSLCLEASSNDSRV